MCVHCVIADAYLRTSALTYTVLTMCALHHCTNAAIHRPVMTSYVIIINSSAVKAQITV